jgi:hypothetical protein
MRKLLFAAIAALSLWSGHAVAQSSNPFNPDFAWCAVQGSVATRGATTWNCLTPGTAGQVLRTNGPAANVSWQTVSGSGTVTSVAATVPAYMTLTGSPVTTTGTLAFGFGSQTANTVFAAPNGSAGAPSFRALALPDIPTMDAAHLPNAGVTNGTGVSGTFPTLNIGTSAITNTMLANSSVSFAKIQANAVDNTILAQMATKTVKSNVTGSTANAADNTITALLDAQLGSTQGTIAYRDSAAWLGLAPSTGNILQSNGAGANPSWVAPSAAIPAAVGIGHRLTLTSATPVLSTAVAAATTVYSTPYQSDLLLLWNGTQFVPTHCAETAQLLSDATKSPAAAVAASNYDMFAWNDSGTCRVTRGPVWTNDTTRALALSRANFGILTNSTAITNGPGAAFGTYMGTIRTDAGGATVTFQSVSNAATCGQLRIPLWNNYNRVNVAASQTLTAASHSYSGSLRQYLADANCSVAAVIGQPAEQTNVSLTGRLGTTVTNGAASVALGLNAATVVAGSNIGYTSVQATGASSWGTVEARYSPAPLTGFYTFNALEDANSALVNIADQFGYNLIYNSAY